MRPKGKKDDSTPSIMDAFRAVKKQPKLNMGNSFRPNEIIDICESQEDVQQGSSAIAIPPTSITVEPQKNLILADKKQRERMSSKARRSIKTAVNHADLREMGCDVEELKVIEANANLECIQEDIRIVRKLISSNCALILPRRAIFILSMFIANWLRIFPIGRICICSSEQEWITALIKECTLMGIDESSFFSLSLSKIPLTSRIMISSSKILNRLVSSDSLSSEIRCVIFHLSGTETPTNLKSAVNGMLMKKIACRFILIGGGGSIGGRSGAIARRQKMITTLHISEWIEPNEDLFVSVTKPRLQNPMNTYSWSDTDNPFLVEVIDQLEEAIKEVMDLNGIDVDVSLTSPIDLVFAPLNLISNRPPVTEDFIRLISLLYHLFSFGKEAFEKRLAGIANESKELEMKLLTSILFTQVLKTMNELEGVEHRKIRAIKDIIHKIITAKRGQHIKGIILVDSQYIVEAVSDCLTILCQIKGVSLYTMGSSQFPLSRILMILQSGGIAIISVDSEEGIKSFKSILSSGIHFVISTSRRSIINVEDVSMAIEWHIILHESRERFREPIDEEEVSFKHERSDTAFTLHSYPFNYESSSLSLDTSSSLIRLSIDKSKIHRLNGISLNPSQRSLLSSRFIKWMNPPLHPILTPSSLLWNESIHSSSSSSLSHRLVSYISPIIQSIPSPLLTSLPCNCTPSNGEIFYSSLISKLSHIFN